MSRNAIAFLAGLGTGYLNQSEKNKERERQDKLDAQNTELHDATMYEKNKIKRQDQVAAEAYAPTTVNENAATLDVSGKPVLYEDAGVANSDYRQARSMAQSSGIANGTPAVDPGTAAPTAPTINPPQQTFAAGGIQYADRAAAQVGADAYNTPEAGNKRAAVAMRGIGDYQGAMQLESASNQAQAADMALADKAWNRKIGQGMMGGHAGIAEVISNSEFGPMAGKKVVAVESPDKATVTYNMVNPDGSLTPSNLTFKNDQDGITQAGYMLNSAITPEHRYTSWQDEKKAKQTQSNADRSFTLQEKTAEASIAHTKVMEGISRGQLSLSQATHAIAAAKADREKLVADSEAKIPAAEKLLLASLGKRIDAGTKAMQDAQAKGEWQPDSPGAAQLLRDVESANDKYTSTITPFLGSGKGKAKTEANPYGLEMTPKTTAQAAPPTATQAAASRNPVQTVAAVQAAAPPQKLMPAQPAPAQPMNSIDQIQSDKLQALAPLALKLKQAEQQFIGAAKSGDQASIASYMQTKEALRAQLEKQVVDQFGNNAQAILQQLYAK